MSIDFALEVVRDMDDLFNEALMDDAIKRVDVQIGQLINNLFVDTANEEHLELMANALGIDVPRVGRRIKSVLDSWEKLNAT